MAIFEVFQTSTFRLALNFAGAFILSTLLLFTFIYWETTVVETNRVEKDLEKSARAMADDTQQDVRYSVRMKLATHTHRLTYASVFAPDGQQLAGNLEAIPAGLPADGHAHRIDTRALGDDEGDSEVLVVVCRQLSDGRLLLIGQSLDSVDNLRAVVLRALRLGLIPTILLALAAGAAMSRRAQRHIKAVRQAAERIMQGHLSERLPTRGRGDDFDRLGDIVNRMLDEIQRLLDEAQVTGDNIAHDLRTPLTRVRARLERASQTAQTHAELREVVERAIAGLDQTLRIITALLRIRQIEAGHRRSNFSQVDLATIIREMGDLFEPFADEKGVRFAVDTLTEATVHGDRDLLSEAIANLVDNAIKFTPAGGRVTLSLIDLNGVPVIRIADTGPGIAPEERDAVMRKFYRSDKSRHIEGCGLGLSLVDAIVKLHGFRVVIRDADHGSIFDMICSGA